MFSLPNNIVVSISGIRIRILLEDQMGDVPRLEQLD